MATHEEEPKKVQYPVDSHSYEILDEIGVGVSAVVYKARCLPLDSVLVAIKSIDLDRSRANFDDVRREVKTLSLLSHPNILNAHCSFTVNHRLWVVMPFMAGGSFQSIISHSFPDGLPEPCIAVVLKEILYALTYLHGQGHLHRDIKAGNILIDSNGLVKLADFGVSASIYESNSSHGASSSSFSSSLMLRDVAGTPYWMAPEVIHSHTGYSFKADIWSFGITALELAHGRPPLSHLPPSKSMILKITKRFRFSDLDKYRRGYNKKFSKAFKDMVASCLDQDPSKRPTAEKLLKHSFFRNCRGLEFLVRNVLQGLPSVEERYRESKIKHGGKEDEEDEEGDPLRQNVKQRRISGWNFNEDGLELDPVFPDEPTSDTIVKQVRFGGETIIQNMGGKSDEPEEHFVAKTGGMEKPNVAENSMAMDIPGSVNIGGVQIAGGVVNRASVLTTLRMLKESLLLQMRQVKGLTNMVHGEEVEVIDREEQMLEEIDMLRIELEAERENSLQLELQIDLMKLVLSGVGINSD